MASSWDGRDCDIGFGTDIGFGFAFALGLAFGSRNTDSVRR